MEEIDVEAAALATGVPAGEPTRRHTATGRAYFWQSASLWIGEGRGRTDRHEHHAHQLALALKGEFRFRSEADGPWEVYDAALVPSHCTHQFDVADARLAHLFVEPESQAGRALVRRFGSGRVRALPPQAVAPVVPLLRGLDAELDKARVVEHASAVLALLSGTTTGPAQELDPRLTRALEYLRANITRPLSLADGARAAALSESRFRHLFVAQTGSSFRAYVLWLRINLAVQAVMAGATWTEAAHAAGFADSAHLTRTHKRVFGIAPTALRPR